MSIDVRHSRVFVITNPQIMISDQITSLNLKSELAGL